jgi:hypothetical protein
MSEIPEDAMKAAWMIVGDIDADFTHDSQTSGNREMKDAQIVIARAILAEREQSAAVADSYAAETHFSLDHLTTKEACKLVARLIAAGIRDKTDWESLNMLAPINKAVEPE